MITRYNIESILRNLTKKEKNRIVRSNKEYIVIELSIFNTGSVVRIKLTDNFNRYKNIGYYGNQFWDANDTINVWSIQNDSIEKKIPIMQKAGKIVEYYDYPGGDHNISSPDFELAMQRSIDFFNKYLK